MELDVHQPVLLRAGEAITDRPERTIRILTDVDELTLSWFRYEPGEEGPDPHVHRRHTDAFYVFGGELELGLGPEVQRMTGRPGTLAAAPPNVVHTFRNTGDSTAVFLNIHAPSMGFGDMLRARRDGREEDVQRFDQFDPPEDGGRPLSDAILCGPGEGGNIESRSSILVKNGARDGDGHFALLEANLPPAYPGPPLHLHRQTVETFFVLSGAMHLHAGEGDAELEAGDFALIPPGLPHTFSNPTRQACRCVVVAAPAGVEEFLREAARADPAEHPALAARHDTFFDEG
ncbi:MAG: cupin domain-containing protein [Gaiellaceae bacterium]